MNIEAENLTRRPEYTAEQFQADWLAESKITSAQADIFGRFVQECDCDYSGCRGWQMGLIGEVDKQMWKGMRERGTY